MAPAPVKPRRGNWNPKKPRPGEVIGGGYIVARRGGGTNRVRAADWPFEFDNLPDAEAEAAKLAARFPGRVFTVWAQVSGAISVAASAEEAA